jgi:Concanavalin A-like lectin/glucanases superfamily
MPRSLLTLPRRTVRPLVAAGLACVAVLAAAPGTAGAATCNLNATPPTLASQVGAATAGQTICLATGDYGTWQGTNKAITLQAADGATPTMDVSFGAGDAGFTLDGMSGMGGSVTSGAHDFTIRNSTFTSSIDFETTNANILLDHNSHDWNAVYNGGTNAKIFVSNSDGAFSGVTVQNSTIRNGNLDGIHLGASINAIGNVFANLCDTGTNHTDNIQFEGGHGGRIANNYVYEGAGCDTQGITSYDSDTVGVTIEDNVVDIRRPWGIELYADKDSIVRHNTLRWYAAKDCNFNIPCGQIDINRKAADPAGSGTQVYDNLATDVNFTNGSTGTEHNNVSGARAVFVGPLDSFAGFKLGPTSPVGLKAASDGLDAGARIDAALANGTAPSGGAGGGGTPLAPVLTAPGTGHGTVPAATTPARAATSRLVASFGFDERSGSRAVDRSGAGNDGRITGARRVRSGRHGRALAFEHVGDHVTVKASSSLDLTKGMTLAAWVRPATSARTWRAAIVKRGGGGLAYGLYANRGRAAARMGAAAGVRARGGVVRAGRWSHLAATYDGKVLRVYVNGVLESTKRMSGAIAGADGPLIIGGNGVGGEGFKGRIDDVRVWSVGLSARSIRAEMHRDASAAPSR